MRAYSELFERDPKSVHPMAERILGPRNELDSDLQEVLSIKGHFWSQSSWRINPSNLYKLLVDIILDDLV